MYRLSAGEISLTNQIQLKGSKSESNRLLVLQKLLGGFAISNLSNSADTQVLAKALRSDKDIVDVGHAGTAMRFLTAYYAMQQGKTTTLQGSHRMHERPIGPLIEALQSMGAEIRYLENSGYPPLEIKGRKLATTNVEIEASISSQFVSALLLIGPFLQNGLELQLRGKITSIPYIRMTLELLERLGISTSMQGNLIQVSTASTPKTKTIEVESDWSSGSYLYSFFALSEMEEMRLGGLRKNSLQGDSVLQNLFTDFGVSSSWENEDLVLHKTNKITKHLSLDCSNFPDLAQTLVVTAFALGVSLNLTGLHTLKIKETNRLIALRNELKKIGAKIQVDEASLKLEERKSDIIKEVVIETYQDHRMAMAFAALATRIPIIITDPKVVDKSFPEFWQVWEQLGITIQEKNK